MNFNTKSSNSNSNLNYPQNAKLTLQQFNVISSYMEKTTGIKMPESKLTMIQSRLTNRLKTLHLQDFAQYIDYVFSSTTQSEEELTIMIDLLTTNLTHFFRENGHFTYLTNSVLPYLVKKGVTTPKIWSAGCSSGEEPYSLSIALKEFMLKNPRTFTDYSITATDISTRILNKAYTAIYPLESVDKLTLDYKRKYFLKSKNKDKPLAKVKKEISSKVNFSRLNFMQKSYNFNNKFDIIFCRNVLIYFDKQTQLEVISRLVDCLSFDGFLFLGHSETIFGSNLPLKTVSATVFQKVKEN